MLQREENILKYSDELTNGEDEDEGEDEEGHGGTPQYKQTVTEVRNPQTRASTPPTNTHQLHALSSCYL